MLRNRLFLSVDLQRDFTDQEGKAYEPRPSVEFIKQVFVPEFRKSGIKTAEIISDYRQPRPGDRGNMCWPGTWGYESILPDDIKKAPVWIKCMNSPVWTRENIGIADKQPGIPRQDGDMFQKWLNSMIGPWNQKIEVILFGLTADCCVLSTAQELEWRGYKAFILTEATDTASGDQKEKEMILHNPPLTNWARLISWSAL